MVSPLFQVFSIERALSTPFNLAQTLAAARAVLFSPNSTTEYKLPSNLMIIPRLMSAVFAIYPEGFYRPIPVKAGGKSTAKTAPGQDLLKSLPAVNEAFFSGKTVSNGKTPFRGHPPGKTGLMRKEMF